MTELKNNERELHLFRVRLTALGYYLEQGTRADLDSLERQASDTARVPECAKDAEGCEWRCEIASDGQQLVKVVQTLADFMQFCVKPAILERAAADAAALKTAKN